MGRLEGGARSRLQPMHRLQRRAKRSAFVPIFSVLYFDLKRKGARIHELTHENREMISRLSHIVANNSLLMGDMSGKLNEIYFVSFPFHSTHYCLGGTS